MKFKIASLEEVEEKYRGLYSQGTDGAYYLAVEGAVDKSKVDEFRNTNVDLMKRLEAFKDLDPSKVQALLENERKIAEKKLIDAGDIEGLVAQRVAAMQADHKRQLTDLQTKYDTNQRQLETLLIDNEVRAAATKIGVAPTAVDDVLLRAKTVFKIEDGKPVAKDANGGIIYGKDGSNSLGISDWAATLKDSAPHLFMTSSGSGSGNDRGTGGGSGPKTAVGKIAAGLQQGSSIHS
jgi:hypothetical protein